MATKGIIDPIQSHFDIQAYYYQVRIPNFYNISQRMIDIFDKKFATGAGDHIFGT